jgi:hypothetical protein
MTDLRDWDVDFADYLGDDWYFDTIFGPDAQVAYSARQLADLFLDQCRRLDLDYDQCSDPETFEELVLQEATEFVREWRAAAVAAHRSRTLEGVAR